MTNQNCSSLRTNSKTLPELARQWSKALERGKGIRLSTYDLEMLTCVGVNDLLQQAAALSLKEKFSCRKEQSQSPYMVGENIGSTGTEQQTDHYVVRTLPSFGTTESDDGSALLARAQATRRKLLRL
jgi:hypothetical protein